MEINTDLPKNIKENAAKATKNILPEKSRPLYDKKYELFIQWKLKNNIAIDDWREYGEQRRNGNSLSFEYRTPNLASFPY
ncbi:hypothetical protein JTB14_014320 [Gonioctena quinquepunctata]|nr:hypothetical protein JTB14_014320 [Gonioctena quinquepunctata]